MNVFSRKMNPYFILFFILLQTTKLRKTKIFTRAVQSDHHSQLDNNLFDLEQHLHMN